jgi:beta-N-acetylhexosaminidase
MPIVIDLAGPTLSPDERGAIADEPLAGVILFRRNIVDRHQARDLVADLLQAAGRDLVVSIDQEGGGVVRLVDVPFPPSAMGLGAADDEALTESVAGATARGLRAVGVNVDFAPVADVQSNPGNPVIGDRAFGESPDLVARHVAAFVRGLQGEGVAATIKHFPGHGDVDVDSHHDLPRLHADRARLERLEWPPFRAGVAAGAAAVMTAHLLVSALDPDLPSTLSRATLTNALRDDLGFDGVVFTDALDMRAIADRWSAADAAVAALAAGADAPLTCGPVALHVGVVRAIERAVRDGRLDPERLRSAQARVSRLLRDFPGGAGEAPRPADHEIVATAARRALVALGELPRLVPGRPVVIVTTAAPLNPASEPLPRPSADLEAALEAAGIPVRRHDTEGAEALALGDAQALIVTTAAARPLDASATVGARREIASARAAGVATVHVALRNPTTVALLPPPALVTFGTRPTSAAAAVHALLTGEAPGRAPVALEVGAT